MGDSSSLPIKGIAFQKARTKFCFVAFLFYRALKYKQSALAALYHPNLNGYHQFIYYINGFPGTFHLDLLELDYLESETVSGDIYFINNFNQRCHFLQIDRDGT